METCVATRAARLTRGAPLAVLALTALWGAARPVDAEAGTAGNAIVRNTITVNYNDAKGNAQPAVTSAIDITVNTVAAAPTILVMTPTPGSTDGTDTQTSYTLRVRTNSNGPGNVALSVADSSPTNIALSSTLPTLSKGSVYLGATFFDPSNFPAMGAQSVAPGGTLTVAVPNDGGKADNGGAPHALPDSSVINGLAVNDTVYVTDGTNYYGPWQVTAVSDPAIPNGAPVPAGSVTLKNLSSIDTLGFAPTAGWQIVEAGDVVVTVTQGVVPYASADQAASWVTTMTATMSGLSTSTPTVTTDAHMGKIVVTKYVRNINTANGSGTAFTPPVFGNDFFVSGVTGNPAEVLEYLAVIKNSGTGVAKNVFATDVTPTYSTLQSAGSYGAGGTSGQIFARASINGATPAELSKDGSGAAGNVDVGYGSATGNAGGDTMSFYLGELCSNGNGGSLNPGDTAYVIYQIKIN